MTASGSLPSFAAQSTNGRNAENPGRSLRWWLMSQLRDKLALRCGVCNGSFVFYNIPASLSCGS